MGKNEENNSWPLIGNEHIGDFLRKSLAGGHAGGAYIFLGPKDLGKGTIAEFFSKSLLCENIDKGLYSACGKCPSCRRFGETSPGAKRSLAVAHPDHNLIGLGEEKKNISIEQIREFIRKLGLSSFSGRYKVGMIKDAETLSEAAANSLLKTLEEPRKDVVIILVASDLDNIPDTISSRSQVLNFYPVKTDLIYGYLVNELGVPRGRAKSIAHLSLGRPALALKFLEDEEFLKDHLQKAEALLDISVSEPGKRMSRLSELLQDTASGRESASRCLSLLEIWRSVARDILLNSTDNQHLMRYESLKDKIKRCRVEGGPLELDRKLSKSEEGIKANVNSRSVLESLVLNI